MHRRGKDITILVVLTTLIAFLVFVLLAINKGLLVPEGSDERPTVAGEAHRSQSAAVEERRLTEVEPPRGAETERATRNAPTEQVPRLKAEQATRGTAGSRTVPSVGGAPLPPKQSESDIKREVRRIGPASPEDSAGLGLDLGLGFGLRQPEMARSAKQQATGRAAAASNAISEGAYLAQKDEVLSAAAPRREDLLRDRGRGLFWNTWFEKNDEIAPLPLQKSSVGPYTLALDLSNYSRSTGSGRASPTLHEVLLREDAASLTVRVVLTNNVAELKGPATKLLKVNMAKLKTEPYNAQLAKSWAEGTISLTEYRERGSAGQVTFEVVASRTGCGEAVFSVWDAAGAEPLDYVLYRFPVGAEAGCPSPGAVQTGANTLLSLAPVLSGESSTQADAAFHIVEVERGRDVVIYAQANGSDTQNPTVHHWTTRTPLSQFIASEAHLPHYIRRAHALLHGHDASPHPFRDAAVQLGESLFAGDEDTDASAKKAKGMFRLLVNGPANAPGKRAVVLVRMSTIERPIEYFPLGLLAAKGNDIGLERPFVTVQPLLVQRYRQSNTCLNPWTLIRPAKALDGDADKTQFDTRFPPAARSAECRFEQRDSIDGLRKYFSEPVCRPSTRANLSPGEGLLLLAHHREGKLYWTDDSNTDNVVTVANINRKFPDGSATVLAACEAVGTKPLARSIIDRLNAMNVESIVASPFPVLTTYASAFSAALSKLIAQAQQTNNTPTLGELYEAAAEQAATELKSITEKDWSDARLEFLILGNSALRLCSN